MHVCVKSQVCLQFTSYDYQTISTLPVVSTVANRALRTFSGWLKPGRYTGSDISQLKRVGGVRSCWAKV